MNKKIAENIIISIVACLSYIGALYHFAKFNYDKGNVDGLKENKDICKKILDEKDDKYNKLVVKYNELIDKDNELIRKLNDLSTEEVHYVKVPISLIVIDFDIKDENGKKCLKKNLEAASKWPPTYAELSKSGEGIHLHYIYKGDPDKLDRIYDENIEIKVFSGGSSLRRKLTQCIDHITLNQLLSF